MTNHEAIRVLGVCSSINGSGLCSQEQHNKAKMIGISAIEKQIPKNPKTIITNKTESKGKHRPLLHLTVMCTVGTMKNPLKRC